MLAVSLKSALHELFEENQKCSEVVLISIWIRLCYTHVMSHLSMPPPTPSLKLLPAYLGTSSIDEATQTARGRRVLWLEILLNDQLDLTPWQNDPAVQEAFRIACRWYTHYRRLLTYLFDRAPLPIDSGPIDFREYRTFAEAVYFAYAHH